MKSSQSGERKSLREVLLKKIEEQETLKDKQKTTANVHVDGKKQMRLWKDLDGLIFRTAGKDVGVGVEGD